MNICIVYDMKNTKFLVSILLAVVVSAAQIGAAFAGGLSSITGTVQSITLETDASTGVTTVAISLLENGTPQTARVNLETAATLGLVRLDGDGNHVINEAALGQPIEIDPTTVIPDEQEKEHPVGSALATFFSDIANLDYQTIMAAHDDGTGFGVIAQALWLTKKMNGDAAVFLAIINAKKTNDFSAFLLEDGSSPHNWGQFKNAVMAGKKNKPSVIVANQHNNGSGNSNNSNNGNGNNGNGNNGSGNGNDKDNKGKNK